MTQSNFDETVRSIAADTHTLPEAVTKMYTDTIEEFSQDARVLDYVTLLAAKRVRANLESAPAAVTL
ncbi:Protein of unknown function [Caballeronia arationis]|uniref:DUF3562 domain-containing protein n=1 Tax=Caballeronia arationis TaxID=1777142 RepID=A0A7Z7N3Z7_9BURK|nr:DUF3562 domain-containing protein [Caballeronia arationis]SOE80653.1 Protein of unknown function [Caballeronia arationis]